MSKPRPRTDEPENRVVDAPVAPDGDRSPISVRDALGPAGRSEDAVRRYDREAIDLDARAEAFTPPEPAPGEGPLVLPNQGKRNLIAAADQARRRRDWANVAATENMMRLPGGPLPHEAARAAEGGDVPEKCPMCEREVLPQDLAPDLWTLDVVVYRHYNTVDRFGVLRPTCSEVCRDTMLRPGRYLVDPNLRLPFAVPGGPGHASTKHAHPASAAYGKAGENLTRSAAVIRTDIENAPVFTFQEAAQAIEEVEDLHGQLETLRSVALRQGEELRDLRGRVAIEAEEAADHE